jgi:hypothetical protein
MVLLVTRACLAYQVYQGKMAPQEFEDHQARQVFVDRLASPGPLALLDLMGKEVSQVNQGPRVKEANEDHVATLAL